MAGKKVTHLKMTREKTIENKIKAYLKTLKPELWFYKHAASPMMPAGIPDIICCYKGVFIGFEVKNATYQQSPAQKVAEELINQAGGIYALVRSVEDVKEIISNLG